MADWTDYTQDKLYREHDLRKTLDRATNPDGDVRDGPHIDLGLRHFASGFVLAILVWFLAPMLGLRELWAIPAFAIGMFAVPLVLGLKRPRPDRTAGLGYRIRRPVVFHVLLWALLVMGLGIWFAISEGDIPIPRAAAVFGALGAGLGLIFGVFVKILRSLRRRRAK